MSLETAAAVGIALLIFMFMAFFAYRITTDKQGYEDSSDTEILCQQVASMLQGVYLAGPGTEFNITLKYNATLSSGEGIYVKSESRESFCHTGVAFTNRTDDEFLIRGNVSFQNINGNIIVMQDI